jgi:hypothetical protein
MSLTPIKYYLALAALVFSSCKSVKENLGEQYDRASDLYKEAYVELKNKEPKEINWVEARAMMLENNLELHRARDSLKRAKESKSQIYWDLVPSLRLSTTLSRALTDLGSVDSRDVRFSVFSTINLPGIVSLYSRRYSAILAELKAEWDLQLKERELIIRLRELFLESADFEQQAFNLRLSENRLSQSLAKILGNFDHRWKFAGGELPEFSYAKNPLDLNDTARLGVLLRRKQAADLEALRLMELATKLRYFPDLNLGVSSPSLYRIGNGRERGFSADDLILHANSVVSLDTSFRLTRQLKNVRRQIELQNRIMKEQIREQIQRTILAQEELLLVERELDLAELRIETLDAQPRSTELDEVRIYLEKRFVLIERASSLRLKKARIEGGFWLLDEDKWINDEKPDEE